VAIAGRRARQRVLERLHANWTLVGAQARPLSVACLVEPCPQRVRLTFEGAFARGAYSTV
jgi:hypothetical protein